MNKKYNPKKRESEAKPVLRLAKVRAAKLAVLEKDKLVAKKTLFYTYRQNNSGGYYYGPAVYVIVEAISSDESDEIAEQNDVYFHGVGDCECCGNRWHRNYEDGTEAPEIYGNVVQGDKGIYQDKYNSGDDYIVIRKSA